MAYGHGCGCSTTRHRGSTRLVYAGCVPLFDVKLGEVVDVTIDMSDEYRSDSHVISGAPVPAFVSSIDNSAAVGTLATSTIPPNRHSIDIIVNTQDPNLRAGEIWRVDTTITMDDGRMFVRSFKLRLRRSDATLPVTVPPVTPTPVTPQPGVIVSGGGGPIPTGAPAAGLYNLFIPPGATWATVQFHTNGVYTTNGMVPNDVTGAGVIVTASTVITLQTLNELMSFRFTGSASGANPVQVYVEFYTADPNP